MPIFILESWHCHTKFMCMNIRAFQKSHKYRVSGCKTKNYPKKIRGTRKGAVSAGYLVFPIIYWVSYIPGVSRISAINNTILWWSLTADFRAFRLVFYLAKCRTSTPSRVVMRVSSIDTWKRSESHILEIQDKVSQKTMSSKCNMPYVWANYYNS